MFKNHLKPASNTQKEKKLGIKKRLSGIENETEERGGLNGGVVSNNLANVRARVSVRPGNRQRL